MWEGEIPAESAPSTVILMPAVGPGYLANPGKEAGDGPA